MPNESLMGNGEGRKIIRMGGFAREEVTRCVE